MFGERPEGMVDAFGLHIYNPDACGSLRGSSAPARTSRRDVADGSLFAIVATQAMTRCRGGNSLMSPGTRRSFAFGAALVLAASAFTAGPVAAQDVPQGGTIVVGEWQRATQLNPYLSNALRDSEAARIFQRSLATVNDQGEFVPGLLAEFPTTENGGLVLDEDGAGFTLNLIMQDGLAWSDGTPLTLHDYKWNYEWAAATGASGEVAGTSSRA